MIPDAKVISKFSVKPMYIIGIGAKVSIPVIKHVVQ